MGRLLHYNDFFAVRIADYRGLKDYTDSKICIPPLNLSNP